MSFFLPNEELLSLAQECSFEHTAPLNIAALDFHEDVRAMCEANRCGCYGKNWCCPPHCGSLAEAAEKAAGFRRGLLLQSTGQMEDDFDLETMLGTEMLHKKRFGCFVTELRKTYPACLPMGTGACTVCRSCACPDEPCRCPELAIPSMEAYGLLVSEVCRASGLPYYYGPHTLTYTACVLVD